ncbi:MAG TPA: Glu-tRNA(Gln) amidotransferase subunit GatE [Nanoarchaeota archaeon]|nr:Glu-tRNA(Gln) amidotransferase subunit GatE [Nanoarchaeota archaeon]
MSGEIDYQKIGFKCGLEIHNRLAVKHKLFCKCPARFSKQEKPSFTVFRKLRAVPGETGEIDVAAEFEFLRDRDYIYYVYEDTCCLVELDEEPPHEINKEALFVALQIAKMLNCEIPEEIHVMRKIIIDGSNTSGFQRTAIVGLNGYIETSKGKVRINTVCLEEESAGIVEKNEKKVIYRLDRLGIPLIEISTAPDIKDPEHAKEVAEKIGMIIRSTGKSQRGIGVTRQDLNVSITHGARVEIKGVQELELIPKVLENEVKRQLEIIKKGEKPKPETRVAKENGLTEFMRPLSGGERMYPETDIPPIKISKEFIESIPIPETLESKAKRFEKVIGKELAEQIVKSEYLHEFEQLSAKFNPKLVARTFTVILKSLKRDGYDISKLSTKHFEKTFEFVEKGIIAKESIEEILKKLCENPEKSIEKIIEELGIKSMDEKEIEKIIDEIFEKYPYLKEQKRFSAIMGEAMKILRGKVDGKIVAEIIKKKLCL